MAKMTADEQKQWTDTVTDDTRNSGKPIAIGQVLTFAKGTLPTEESFVGTDGVTHKWYALTSKEGERIAVNQLIRRDSFKTPRFNGNSDKDRVLKLGEALKTADVIVKVADSFYGGRNNRLYLTFE